MILTALLHTIGNTLPSPPTDKAYVALERSMRAYTIPLGLGMVPSMWDINQSLVFTMSITLATMGILSLVIGMSREPGRSLPRTIAIIQAVASAALTVLFYVAQVTPAFVSMAVVTLLFGVAIFEAGSAR